MSKKIILIFLIVSFILVGKEINLNASSMMTGKLTYHKENKLVSVKNSHSTFIYNHVPNSKYTNIKRFKLNKINPNEEKYKLKIDLMASQSTQYNWYRFKVKINSQVKNYWIYGNDLKTK